MAFPKQKDVEIPLLQELAARGGQAAAGEVIDGLVKRFPGLTPADLQQKKASAIKAGNKQTKWRNRVNWARLKLKHKGELDSPARHVWRITEKGRERLAKAGVKVAIAGTLLAPSPTVPTPAPPEPPSRTPPVVVSPATDSHKDLLDKIAELGQKLGMHTEIELALASVPYRHDVRWRKNPYISPSVVWEVCVGGYDEKDINSLNWAVDSWGALAIWVIADVKEYEKARTKVPSSAKINIVRAEELDKLHGLMDSHAPLLEKLFRRCLT